MMNAIIMHESIKCKRQIRIYIIFIAIAIVVLGRWRPLGVAAAALLFGAAYTLQNLFQSMGWQGIPYNLFLAVPYVLTLVVLATSRSSSAAAAQR